MKRLSSLPPSLLLRWALDDDTCSCFSFRQEGAADGHTGKRHDPALRQASQEETLPLPLPSPSHTGSVMEVVVSNELNPSPSSFSSLFRSKNDKTTKNVQSHTHTTHHQSARPSGWL